MKLTTEVRKIAKTVRETADLEPYRPLVALLLRLAQDFDAGELPAIAVQQLRMGLKEVREGMDLAQETGTHTSNIDDLLTEYRTQAEKDVRG